MTRRLAAILAADVVGCSAMMERDEASTLSLLQSYEADVTKPAVNSHGGRKFKRMGDGFLVEFASPNPRLNDQILQISGKAEFQNQTICNYSIKKGCSEPDTIGSNRSHPRQAHLASVRNTD